MLERFRRSWQLTQQSAAVLMRDKELLLFPVLSALSSLAVILSFLLPLFASQSFDSLQHHRSPATYLLLFAFYFCNYFVTIFFNCALAGAANKALSGEHATLGDGLRIAMQRIVPILVWTVVATTVGMVLKALEQRAGKFGQIAIAILGAAWSILTYFIIPVVVFEDLDVADGVKRSAALVKKSWGEGVSAGVTFIALTLGALVPCAVLAFALFNIQPWAAALFVVIYIALLVTVVSAMDGIFKVALYRYAAQGTVVQGFDPALIQGAFVQKK